MNKFEQEPWCPKCLHKDVNILYQALTAKTGPAIGVVHEEFLTCTCRTCQYVWNMPVAEEPEEDLDA